METHHILSRCLRMVPLSSSEVTRRVGHPSSTRRLISTAAPLPLRPRLLAASRQPLTPRSPSLPAAYSSVDEGDTEAEGPTTSQSGASSWPRKVLQLPLEIATVVGDDDAHYLEKRGRKRWWRRSGTAFPRLPPASLARVHKHPPPLSLWQKVLPLAGIFFAASFNLTVLQTLKDAILVTAAGAEVLPYLAAFGVLPASLGFFVFYGRLVENLPQRSVFYAAALPLALFYAAFALAIYPNHAALHPVGLSAAAASWVPQGLMGLVKGVEYWTFSLFFCAAELWGAVVISVLFWSLANEVCTVEEAKSVYPLVGVAANVALVLAGSFVKAVNAGLAAGSTQAMLNWLVGGITASTAAMFAVKALLDRFVVAPYCALDPLTASKPAAARKKKRKGSFGDSLAVVRASSKISNLAVLVIGYGLSHRLFEFAWKGALRAVHSTPQTYQSALADVSIATGWATITFMLLGRLVFQHFGWGAAASATPVAMLLSGGAFFGLSLAGGAGISIGGLDPAGMAWLGVLAGSVTQVAARASKYSLFDPAKEMVYIGTSQEERSKGKAAVDLLGSQIGKTGGAWVTNLLVLMSGSLVASMPAVTVAFVGVLLAWLKAVKTLEKQLEATERTERIPGADDVGAKGSTGMNGSGESTRNGDGPAEGDQPVVAVNSARPHAA